MKKLLVPIMAVVMTLSLAACGGDAAPTYIPDTTPSSSAPSTQDSIDFVEVTGNGLSFALPADIKYVKTEDGTGTMLFVNEDATAVVSLGVKIENNSVTSADVTEELLFDGISAGGVLSNATLDNYGTGEQDGGGTAVVAFGKVTMDDGMDMHSDIQYYFTADGSGYYMISYLYAVDKENSLGADDNIARVMSTVKSAE